MRDTETVEPSAPVPPTAELRAGTVIDERYRIVRVIGRGGAAVVYEAIDTTDDHRIALKLLHRVSDASIQRMQREIAIAQQCDDPLLVRYHDIATSAAGTYVTMELVDAITLREYRSRCVPTIREVIAIAKQLTRAIGLLHARGVLHRDIKPSNVLICPDGTIKLADFGLALDTADPERLTRTDAIVGTIDYLAPEQVLGRNVDERADLYSLGVLLFELLTGELPYPPTSSLGTLLARIRHPAPDVRTRRRDVPAWLARLVARLLRPSPADRYRSSDEVLAALRAERVARQWRRPAFVTACAVVLMITTALAIRAMAPHHRFAEVRQDGDGVVGVDDRGEPLWRIPGLNSRYAAIVHDGGRPTAVAFVNEHGTLADEETNRTLSLLDVATGTIRTIPLTDARGAFPDFAPTFHVASLTTAPIERGGHDFVLVTYIHRLYWPTYTVIVDPITGASGPAFLSSGNHFCVGSLDVAHDGRLALIFVGVNNRLGWYTSAAAVHVDVHRDPGLALPQYAAAGSPDQRYEGTRQWALAWYTLVTTAHYTGANIVDGKLVIDLADGKHVAIDSRGDVVGQRPVDRPKQRLAYEAIAAALRLRAGGFMSDALSSATGAVSDASASGDTLLPECARRVHASLLAENGRASEAEQEFSALMERSAIAADVAYDAARTFHRRNDLANALRWYREARLRAVDDTAGRMQYEAFEGEVLTLQALGRSEEALRTCDEFARGYPNQAAIARVVKEYVHWRNGEPVTLPQVDPNMPDELRYWNLEYRLANGDAPSVLLPQIVSELRQASGTQPLLESLRAEVLFRLHDPHAAGVIQRALRDARTSNDPLVIAHAPLIAERARRIGT